jgi:biotin carboxylase
MKLLAIEARQRGQVQLSRYEQVRDFGADLFVLNGLGEDDYWPAGRYRIAGSQHIDDIVAAARAWHDQEDFDGVFTFAESAVAAVAVVADALGLPGVGLDAARKSRNKLLMRQAHLRAGTAHPRFSYVASLDEAQAVAAGYGYPVVLKPTLGAASSFVFRVDDPGMLAIRYQDAAEGIANMPTLLAEAAGLDVGPSGLMIESFLDGAEYLFEALVWDDEFYLGSVVDRVTLEGETFDDDVHQAPTSLSAGELAKIHSIVQAAAREQGLRRSVLHAEIRYHDGEPHLLEIAIRPGGGGLDLVARATAGYCPIRAVMDVARGVRPAVRHYQPTGVHMMGTCLICDEGELDYVTVPAEVSESALTLMAKITARPGEMILRPPHGNNILGFLIVTGPSFAAVKQTLEEFAAKIDVKLAGQPVTKTAMPWQHSEPESGPAARQATASAAAT